MSGKVARPGQDESMSALRGALDGCEHTTVPCGFASCEIHYGRATARQGPAPIHDQLIERIDHLTDLYRAGAALRAVLDLARSAEMNALRWEDQLPVPDWVRRVRYEIAGALDPHRGEGAQ